MTRDLLVRRARLVAKGRVTDDLHDVVFDGGRVAAIERDARDGDAARVLDAEEEILAPGLVDIHVHAWWGATHMGIDIDEHSIDRGVTTAVDAGSAGAATFRAFQRFVLARTRTRAYALLNISGMGQLDIDIGECEDLRWCNVEKAVATARAHPGAILGIKVRLSEPIAKENDLAALALAVRAGTELGLPVMIHIGGSCHSLEEILAQLRPGDIVTHCYTGLQPGILDADGRVLPAVRAARAQGVLFDVGHGRGSFTFEVAERAIEQGFLPSTISSDLHRNNVNGPVFDLVTTLTKFRSLGLPLAEVLAMGTSNAAAAVGLAGRAGTLAVGSAGDATLIREERGTFTLEDSIGVTRKVGSRITAIRTIHDGVLLNA